MLRKAAVPKRICDRRRAQNATGRVNGQDINGWFIGFIENADNTYFFATNIQNEQHATGSKAADITLSILSDLNIWK